MQNEEDPFNRRSHGIPLVGQINFGDFRRLEPFTRSFGYDRGQPIDRYYIEKFLSKYASDIAGHVVEIGDDRYTRQFGGSHVIKSDVLDQDHPDSKPTIIADLAQADHLPSNCFDCIIIIQTLQFIYKIHDAVNTIHRVLKPGGVVLCSIPSLSPICRYDMERWGDYWRFTSAAVQQLFGNVFEKQNVQILAHGNVLVSLAFLYGMASHELTNEELDFYDQDYETLITVRAVKAG